MVISTNLILCMYIDLASCNLDLTFSVQGHIVFLVNLCVKVCSVMVLVHMYMLDSLQVHAP